MSSIAVTASATGAGVITLAAPVTATNRTITLPDNTGTAVTTGSVGVVTPAMTQVGALPSMVRLNTGNGFGSTNTVIRRFTNVVTNQGADITYADSATLGSSFVINTNGVYAISYSDSFAGGSDIGLSLNSSQLSTGVNGISVADRLAQSQTVGVNTIMLVSWTGYLIVGSIIRPHDDTNGTGTRLSLFTISRVA